MIRFHPNPLPLLTACALVSCGSPTPPPPAAQLVPSSDSPREQLTHLVERYWDENAVLGPWFPWGGAEIRYGEAPSDAISAQTLADSLALERRYLKDLLGVSKTALDPDAKQTFDLFRRERELTIESFTYPSELMPVNGYDSMPQRFALLAAAAESHALASQRDFENWQARVLAYNLWTQQAIVNLRDGTRRGYTLPLAVIERTLQSLASLSEDVPTNAFYAPLHAAAAAAAAGDAAGDAERQRLSLAITTVIKEKILPAYRTLHDFLQREYLPRARVSVGLSELPLGPAWYAFLVKRASDNSQTPAMLHALGLAEVERARTRIQALLSAAAFSGTPQEFVDSMRHDPRHSVQQSEALFAAYDEIKAQVDVAVPTLFSTVPHADFETRNVEAFRTLTAAPLSYRRALASGRYPAVLYINAADLQTRPAIGMAARFLREAVPGHHFQLALQQERADIPRFRRLGGSPAFIEGWGLYAASLGDELGVYHDPEAKFSALLAQLECAAGMVIDTGVHAQKWSRAQALDYLHAQVPIDDVAAANMVDRALALPGDALACTAGFVRLVSLRAHAQQALGARFDVKAFHAELLRAGAIPLDLLEDDVKIWVEGAAKLD